MTNSLLIIDALNLIRRIDAISIKQHTQDSQRLQATKAATNQTVKRLLNDFQPSHVVAVFEQTGIDWRNHLYADYKANRSEMPIHLAQGLTELQDNLLHIGVDSLLNPAIQADDLIATLASKASSNGLLTTIISTDHGYWQLLNQNTSIQVYNHFQRRFIDEQRVYERYHVHLNQLLDYWALTGSNSVNLKGVVGIGAKTAARLLTEYGSLTSILKQPKGQDKAIDKVLEAKEDALLCAKLMQFICDLPLGFNLKQLRYNEPKSSLSEQ